MLVAMMFFSLIVCTWPVVAATPYRTEMRRSLDYFGTISMLRIDLDPSDDSISVDRVWQDIKTLLNSIDQAVSTEIPTSDIARFNALESGQSTEISEITASLLEEANFVYEKTNGLFDPTAHIFVDLWGFTPRFFSPGYEPVKPYDREREEMESTPVSSDVIDTLRPLVDFSSVLLEGDAQTGYTLTKQAPPVYMRGEPIYQTLDLGGIAKGYAVDQVARLLKDAGVEYGYFSCGGSSAVFLRNGAATSRDDFRVGVDYRRHDKKDDSPYLMMLNLSDVTLTTSGDARQVRVIDDILYSHIIDPRTGWPVNTDAPREQGQQGISQVSLIADNATRADALATALCLMPPEQVGSFMDEHYPDWHVFVLEFDTTNDEMTYKLSGRSTADLYELVLDIEDTVIP